MAINRPVFFFDYEVHSDGSLSKAILVDGIARRNYSVFGDGVSFDPTYSTNKYGIWPSHFSPGRFLVAMGGKESKYIITDQDPGILKVVPLVFKIACHRYCMWHIMNKVPSKYGVTRKDYSEFLKKMNAIIWDENIEAAEFDAKWEEIGREHTVNNID
ncbi:protein FAR1-RELATED SEQUENCE 4-like [Silene latifolia]|uniref:protein FAR1-RELATED SEQUENCE 4-like n=1 Tax=Silene latifolia TaxID=37657 RepID=UPI003D77D0D2